MGDMGEYFREEKAAFRDRRDKRVAEAPAQLAACGLKYRDADNGYHYIIETSAGLADYWPSRGKWFLRKHGWHGTGGLQRLLDHLSRRASESSSGEPREP
jgi:hypothetical protein